MADFIVSAEGFADIFTKQESARQRRATREGPMDAALESAHIVAMKAPRDIGKLSDSVHVLPHHDDGTLVAEIEVNTPYAAAVENGSRPHMPPLAPLVAWVRRNWHKLTKGSQRRASRVKRPKRSVVSVRASLRSLGFGREDTRRLLWSWRGTRNRERVSRWLAKVAVRRPTMAADEAAILEVAKAIQQKIARYGIAPTHFMRSTLPKQLSVLRAHVRHALQDV